MNHTRWKPAREERAPGERAGTPGAAEATQAERAEIRRAMAFAKAVYDRRKALGLSQAELAGRAGLTWVEIARVEGADVLPTLPLLRRLTHALGVPLDSP